MHDAPLTTASIPQAVQRAALAEVLVRVAEAAASKLRPVIEIDLDLTALCPKTRTRRALLAAAKEVGVDIDLLDAQPLLPGYTAEAWEDYLSRGALRRRYAAVPWGGAQPAASRTVYAAFHDAYWTDEWLVEDEPTPGLGEFVRAVEDRGGLVVFLSGRWRVEQVAPSLASLRRAGIAAPALVIGNHRHERNVRPGEEAWSDARVKMLQQEEIRRRFGLPVAVFDDRAANRDAVVQANAEFLHDRGLPSVLGVAVAVPGFSHDPATDSASKRISSFESFSHCGLDSRREPYLVGRYPSVASGVTYRGSFGGVGRNGRGYVLPRVVDRSADVRPPAEHRARYASLAEAPEASVDADSFMSAAEETIPLAVQERLRATLSRAQEEARSGLAAPYPDSTAGRTRLWHALACSWLHSRDMEVAMNAVGYPLALTGVHDLEDFIPTEDLLQAITVSLEAGNAYSAWFLRWLARLDRRSTVNVGFLNPSLTVSLLSWRGRDDAPQDAMDAHRVSSHHLGDNADRYDPIEATLNNLLHAREGVYGVQGAPVVSWASIDEASRTLVARAALAKSSFGASLLCDAIPLVRQLEATGHMLPWSVVREPGDRSNSAKDWR